MRRLYFILILLLVPFGLSACLDAMVQQKVTTLEERIQQSPTDAAAHRELGQTWFNAGYDEKAIEHLSMATKLDPRHPHTWTLLGLAFSRSGQHDQAVRALKAGESFGQADNTLALGTAYLGVGEVDEGVKHIRQALAKDPSLAEVVRAALDEAKETPVDATATATPGASEHRVMQETLDDVLDDFKEQARQEVREQIAEDLILRQQ